MDNNNKTPEEIVSTYRAKAKLLGYEDALNFKIVGTKIFISYIDVSKKGRILIPSFVTLDENLYAAFRGSDASEVIIMADTSNVLNMNSLFYGCKATNIEIGSIDTSSVTDMGYMFGMCSAKKLDLSNFDTSNVVDMNDMFLCSEAMEIKLSSFDTSNVTSMSSMFYACEADRLDLRNFDTSNVTSMYQMFKWSRATYIDISNFDISKVTSSTGIFDGCKAKQIIIPKGNWRLQKAIKSAKLEAEIIEK